MTSHPLESGFKWWEGYRSMMETPTQRLHRIGSLDIASRTPITAYTFEQIADALSLKVNDISTNDGRPELAPYVTGRIIELLSGDEPSFTVCGQTVELGKGDWIRHAVTLAYVSLTLRRDPCLCPFSHLSSEAPMPPETDVLPLPTESPVAPESPVTPVAPESPVTPESSVTVWGGHRSYHGADGEWPVLQYNHPLSVPDVDKTVPDEHKTSQTPSLFTLDDLLKKAQSEFSAPTVSRKTFLEATSEHLPPHTEETDKSRTTESVKWSAPSVGQHSSCSRSFRSSSKRQNLWGLPHTRQRPLEDQPENYRKTPCNKGDKCPYLDTEFGCNFFHAIYV